MPKGSFAVATPYLYERQTEYWTSRGIESYFLDAGYQIVTFPLSQIAEEHVPFDFVFLQPTFCKMFGIQYKSLYKNGSDHWRLTEHQHINLQEFEDWAFYGLSEMKLANEHGIALHKTMFVPVNIDYHNKLHKGDFGPYYRWGGFVTHLEQCTIGRKVDSADDIRNAIRPAARQSLRDVDEYLVDIFVANLEAHRLLHLQHT